MQFDKFPKLFANRRKPRQLYAQLIAKLHFERLHVFVCEFLKFLQFENDYKVENKVYLAPIKIKKNLYKVKFCKKRNKFFNQSARNSVR